MLIPFTGGKYLDIGWVAIPLMFFVVIGTVNGVNFTDGLDGRAWVRIYPFDNIGVIRHE